MRIYELEGRRRSPLASVTPTEASTLKMRATGSSPPVTEPDDRELDADCAREMVRLDEYLRSQEAVRRREDPDRLPLIVEECVDPGDEVA